MAAHPGSGASVTACRPVALTHALVESLTALSEDQVAELWLEEAERRDTEMESGRVVGIPGEEVSRRLYVRYRK
jgi:Putative addiction module component